MADENSESKPQISRRLRLRVAAKEPSNRMPVWKQWAVFVVFIWVLIPIFVFCLAWMFGGILARVEDWEGREGFYYCISKLCGLTNPLVDLFPASPFGKVVDVAISLWGMALNGVIAGVISTLTLLVNLVRLAETAKLKRLQKEDVSRVVDELEEDEKLDFDAFYDAMEQHAHTERSEALAIFEAADVEHTGLLTKSEAEDMMRNWQAPVDVEEQTPEQAEEAAAAVAAHKAAHQAAHQAAHSPAGVSRESGVKQEAEKVKQEEEEKAEKAEPEEETEESWFRVLLVFFLFVFIIVPAVLCLASLIFGAMLADAEGWDWQDGFLYVITNLCILGGELTPSAPASDRGRTVDVVIGLWSLSVQGSVIGVVGALSIHERLVKTVEGLAHEKLKSDKRAAGAGKEKEAVEEPTRASKSKLQYLETKL